MNSDTGKVYSGEKDISAAVMRGERLVPVSERAAKKIRLGRSALAERLHAERRKKRARQRDRMQKASRKANR